MLEKQDFERVLGKKIKIITRNDYNYNGSIVRVNEGSFEFLDKFGNVLYFNFNAVNLIEVRK